MKNIKNKIPSKSSKVISHASRFPLKQINKQTTKKRKQLIREKERKEER